MSSELTVILFLLLFGVSAVLGTLIAFVYKVLKIKDAVNRNLITANDKEIGMLRTELENLKIKTNMWVEEFSNRCPPPELVRQKKLNKEFEKEFYSVRSHPTNDGIQPFFKYIFSRKKR